MFELIDEVIQEIRPFIHREGGDVELVDYEEGIVYVRLLGACSNCPSSYITLKSGIEQVLKERLGNDIIAVEQVY